MDSSFGHVPAPFEEKKDNGRDADKLVNGRFICHDDKIGRRGAGYIRRRGSRQAAVRADNPSFTLARLFIDARIIPDSFISVGRTAVYER